MSDPVQVEVMSLIEFDENPKSRVLEVAAGFRPPLLLTRFGRFVAMVVPISDSEIISKGINAMIESGEIQP